MSEFREGSTMKHRAALPATQTHDACCETDVSFQRINIIGAFAPYKGRHNKRESRVIA